jgi:hypothetical protein
MLGYTNGEIVGLAAGAGEHGVAKMGWAGAEKFFCVVEDDLAQVTSVRVKRGGLPR